LLGQDLLEIELDTSRRTIAKAITWQCVGILSMIGLAFFHSGNLVEALSLALSASVTGFIFYFIHERAWSRIRWGRKLR
jgi:uncharacterized membrane protein